MRLSQTYHWRVWLALLVATLAQASLSGTASACGGFSQLTSKDYARMADTVLVGSVGDSEAGLVGLFGGQHVAVERYLKGTGPARVTVRAEFDIGGAAMPPSIVGTRFILFLTGAQGSYVLPECWGGNIEVGDDVSSRMLIRSMEEITGPGTLPLENSGFSGFHPIGAGLLAVSGLIIRLLRRRNAAASGRGST